MTPFSVPNGLTTHFGVRWSPGHERESHMSDDPIFCLVPVSGMRCRRTMHNLQHVENVQVEWLEGRCLYATAFAASGSSALEAAVAHQSAMITYIGATPGVNYIDDPESVSYATVEEVSVAATSPGGAVPTGTVAFFLDGVLAGDSAVNASGVASFQADPGLYALTAEYSGDQIYSPADLSDTRVQIPNSATGPSPFSGLTITTSMFPVSDVSGTSVVAPGEPIQDSFDVFVNNAGLADKDSISAGIFVEPVNDPEAIVNLQDPSGNKTFELAAFG